MTPQPWIVRALEQCASKCLDTEEERAHVASTLQAFMVGPDTIIGEPDISVRDLAERVVQGRTVSPLAHREIATYLLAVTGTRKE